ncbi:MAG TPA: hypothetical protein VKG66_05910, partial [Steroidobacteraceae bacterium]|nr:hypothetical protein [Steroidobacteraceae bacterium]
KGKMRAQVVYEALVSGDQFAVLLFSQGNVHAVGDCGSGLRRDANSAEQEWSESVQLRDSRHDVASRPADHILRAVVR